MYKPLIALALLLAVVSALTTQATPTATPSRPDCWTCPPNYVHWWETGMDDSECCYCYCDRNSKTSMLKCKYESIFDGMLLVHVLTLCRNLSPKILSRRQYYHMYVRVVLTENTRDIKKERGD
jgi:hypothetical protein